MEVTSPIVIWGDFNVLLDPTQDRSSTKSHGHAPRVWQALKNMLHDLVLLDVWRYRMGARQGFTFHSKMYGHFTRLDYFFVDRAIEDTITTISILPGHISDHAAVIMSLEGYGRLTLKRVILSDLENGESLKRASTAYFIDNIGFTSLDVVWDAFKAYIRGVLQNLTYFKTITESLSFKRMEDRVGIFRG